MRRAIQKHLRDFVVLVGMIAIALAVAGYILAHQRLRFPVLEEKPFIIKAEFRDAQAVVPGQGQTIRVAGMRVGDIGGAELRNGLAVVTFELDPEYDDLVRVNARALLRPRTGLKDMFVELDPGSRDAPLMKENGVIKVDNTSPDIDADEVLEALDSDTRAYLRLLINGAGKGLKGRAYDLREVLRRLGPLHRDLRRVNGAIAERRRNLSRLIHNYGSTISELAKKDRELTTFVTSNRRVFEALASEEGNISLAVSRLPSTLAQLERTLVRVDELGDTMGPAFEALRPAVRRIDPANRQSRPFFLEAEPILRERIRPFVRAARPYISENVRPAAQNLARAQPDLRESFFELNRFFNMAAYNPRGNEPIPPSCEVSGTGCPPGRDEGLLYWLGWVSQNGVSIFSTGDAQGPFRRILFTATCSTYRALVEDEPALSAIMNVTELLSATGHCPPS